MLEDLIISKVRVKILQLFFSSIGKSFHVREIVRQTQEEINAVRRELAHLEKAGILSSEWRANRRYYELKRDYLFYPEILALITKTTGLGGEIIKNKTKLGKIKFAFLSGGFVRGQNPGKDDVDLLIVGNIVLPQLVSLIHDEEVRREREINYTVMTEEEFNFRLKRRDPFIVNVLGKDRIMVLGDQQEMLEHL